MVRYRRLEDRIRHLCARLITLPEASADFHSTGSQLRADIREHAQRLRARLGNFPFFIERRALLSHDSLMRLDPNATAKPVSNKTASPSDRSSDDQRTNKDPTLPSDPETIAHPNKVIAIRKLSDIRAVKKKEETSDCPTASAPNKMEAPH
jgi:hypothetical protein